MDNLFEQIANISKAGAYDAMQPHYAEAQKQSKEFRKALNDVLDAITKAKITEIIDNPVNKLQEISNICLDALKNNRPL